MTNTFGADTDDDVTDWGEKNIEEKARTFSGPVYIDREFITRIVKRICELSDRSSPYDQPDMMLVTADELRFIIDDELRDAPAEGAPL